MRTKGLRLGVAVLVIGMMLAPGSIAHGRAAASRGQATEEPDEAQATTTEFCMQDNFNRIFKLTPVTVLLIGQLWARPFNGFVIGTVIKKEVTGQYQVQMSFFDPSVFTSWTCQGTGQSIGYFNGTCKAGQQTLPWQSFKMSLCPF